MQSGRDRSRIYGALLLSIVFAGCASSGPPARTTPATAADGALADPPRSRRGNPPFYDVFGKRYYVLATADGYRERGVASWYGRDFHGLSTSSGERYDMHALTAAHTRLPIPTWVEVTNLENGKRVVVRVNDRGPFVDDRIIDLSYAAATELDMIRNGTARVEVRALGSAGAPVTATTAAVNGTPPSPPRGASPGLAAAVPPVLAAPGVGLATSRAARELMFVQVGAFSEHDNAAKLVDRLKASGFANPVVVTEGGGRRALHRVRVGPLRDAAEFDRVSVRLRALGVTDSHLVVER
jgi:rare lipoprotein A